MTLQGFRQIVMRRAARVGLVAMALGSTVALAVAFVSAGSSPAAAARLEPRRDIKITYLGNAGWQIDDGRKVILVDPYLTEFRNGGKDNQNTDDDPIVVPDTAGNHAGACRWAGLSVPSERGSGAG